MLPQPHISRSYRLTATESVVRRIQNLPSYTESELTALLSNNSALLLFHNLEVNSDTSRKTQSLQPCRSTELNIRFC